MSSAVATRLSGPAAVTAGSVAGMAAIGLRDPHVAGNWPTCPFYALTGLYCPGCGTMRACWDVLHLDFAGAIGSNPLAVVAGVLLMVSLAAWWVRSLQPAGAAATAGDVHIGDPLRWRHAAVIFAVAVPVFWVARNLPWLGFLAP